MKKLLSILALTFMLVPMSVLAVSANAQGATNGNSASTGETSTATATSSATSNSGTSTQIETQNRVQTNNPGTGTMTQTEAQERLELQVEESKPTYTATNAKSSARLAVSSEVAEKLVGVASRVSNASLADQIRVIAQNQSANQDAIGQAVDKVEERSAVARFLMGPNFTELKNAKQTMEQNRLQIRELEQLMSQVENEADKLEVANQIIILQNQQIELADQLGELSGGFTLFGWLGRWVRGF